MEKRSRGGFDPSLLLEGMKMGVGVVVERTKSAKQRFGLVRDEKGRESKLPG